MAKNNFSDAFGDLNAAIGSAGDSVVVLPLSAVIEDPNNPRSNFDEAELAALAETIREKGVLQPITVRPAGSDGRHTIRFGARRLRAAQLAGLKEIRALVQAGDAGEDDLLIEQLIENDQREPLNTADLARAVDKLFARKLSQSDIARRLGRPRDQIALLASVRAMPPQIQALAAEVGVRTLFELNSAWKADHKRVETWLAARDPKKITQADARELAGRPVVDRRTVRDPSDGSVNHVDLAPALPAEASARKGPRARAASPPSTPSSVGLTATFEVSASSVKGTLVLDNVQSPSLGVLIRTADGDLVPVPAAKVKLIRVKPG